MHWDTLLQDVRYTLRRLRHDSGFALAAVLIIGLGVGSNTAIFSVVNTLLFRPMQFRGSDRLVWIANAGAGGDGTDRELGLVAKLEQQVPRRVDQCGAQPIAVPARVALSGW